MIHAYDKLYLGRARMVMGFMLDYATLEMGYELGTFFDLFLSSGLAKRFERGDCSVIAGRSGTELVYDVLDTHGIAYERRKPQCRTERSEEYWTGWALAYYQWETALSFSEIVSTVPLERIRNMYMPFHEMDIRQFVDQMNDWYRRAHPETNLKRRRCRLGLSQRQLSEDSGVPLRTIQQYEQRQKDINMARAECVVMLAQSLCCSVMDLMELVPPAPEDGNGTDEKDLDEGQTELNG